MIVLQTNYGDIKLELNADTTPATVKNFLNYAKEGLYDDTIFHRVIANFMIQCGGLTEDMEKRTTFDPIENEADKGGSNLRGTIAMARTGDPHSATSQFFINLKDNKFLDFKSQSGDGWGYCVFGKVVDGMDVVDQIAKVATTSRAGHQDVPEEAVTIKKMIVEELVD